MSSERKPIFVVRGGKDGEWEGIALGQGRAIMEWDRLPDLSTVRTRYELRSTYVEIYGEEPVGGVENRVGQIWVFLREMGVGDNVVLPLKTQRAVALGRVRSDYRFTEFSYPRHWREVEWVKILPRSSFDSGTLRSFGNTQSIYKIKKKSAERDILDKMLEE